MRSVACALLICLLGITQASAGVQILRHDPPPGKLPAGQSVLVDDGSCPKGQIKEVKAGSNRRIMTNGKLAGSVRVHHCVKRS